MKAVRSVELGWLIIGSVCFAFGLVLGIGFTKDFWSEVTAAWVQAIGSIAAIAAGFLYIEHQTAAVRQADQHRQRAGRDGSRAAIDAMSQFIEARIRAAGRVLREGTPPSRGDMRLYVSSFKSDLGTAGAFTSHSQHSVDVIIGFGRFTSMMAATHAELEHLLTESNSKDKTQRSESLKSATDNIEITVDTLASARTALSAALLSEAQTDKALAQTSGRT
jgi:hypothetical protein